MKQADIIVIGGGATGAACALGLIRKKAGTVLMLDETPGLHRVSRANFGLTTYSLKGLNDKSYAEWALQATKKWTAFSLELEQMTGINLDLSLKGGGEALLSEQEKETRVKQIRQLKNMTDERGSGYPGRILDRNEFSQLIPKMELGDKVIGGLFFPGAGHVNPLFMLRAMRKAFLIQGGTFIPGESVMEITPGRSHTIVKTGTQTYACEKLVIAAGHGSTRLMGSLGVKLPVYPLRGQLLVTNRMPPLLPIPLLNVRQTGEGTFMVGVSIEHAGHDVRTTVSAMKAQAQKAIEVFPVMAGFKWVRSWAAIRVMTPDDSPIYDELPGLNNIFILAGHSAISLAPLHASIIPQWIISGKRPDEINNFGLGRFHV